MEAFASRASVLSWNPKELSSQDLSDLLWAANGVNRPDGKRTAPSAGNAQDVEIYVFLKDGAYLYDAANHALNLLAAGDYRSEVGISMAGPPPGMKAGAPGESAPGEKTDAPPGKTEDGRSGMPAEGPSAESQGSTAPVNLVLVTDYSKFPFGTEELKARWAAIDVGLVSENIAIFCAAKGMGTRPIAGINEEKLRPLLNLKDSQAMLLRHPVGYLTDAN
jgi:nitroreductase